MFEISSFLEPVWPGFAALAVMTVAGYLVAEWKWRQREAVLRRRVDQLQIELIKCQHELEWHNPPVQRQVLKSDNLKVIDGIDRRVETLFHKAGIRTYQKLSETPVEKLRQLVTVAGSGNLSQQRLVDWPAKAREINQMALTHTAGIMKLDLLFQMDGSNNLTVNLADE